MSSRRILVVDDERPIVQLLEEALVEGGYQVDGAYSGAEALKLIRENLYDAAIFDFALPDTNGVMLHRQVREMDEELANHTIFISGVSQSELDISYYSSDAGGSSKSPSTCGS